MFPKIVLALALAVLSFAGVHSVLGAAGEGRRQAAPASPPPGSAPATSAAGGEGDLFVPALTPLRRLVVKGWGEPAQRALNIQTAIHNHLMKKLRRCLDQFPGEAKLELTVDVRTDKRAIALDRGAFTRVISGAAPGPEALACMQRVLSRQQTIPFELGWAYLEGHSSTERIYLDHVTSCK